MFAKFATFVVVSLIAVSGASASTCSTGTLSCCNSIKKSTDYNASDIASLLNIAVSDVTGQLGVSCTAVTGIGAGTGANCQSQTACCKKLYSQQLIGVDCNPVSIGA